MELRPEKGFRNVKDPFIGFVVIIVKPFAPVLRQRIRIQGIPVILDRNITAFGAGLRARLILTAVPILQFIEGGAGRQPQDLGPQTNSEDRRIPGQSLPDIFDSLRAGTRIARPVREDNPINFLL